MKLTIQMLILILICSCGESQIGNKEVVSQMSTNQKEFIPDSSYVDYWCSIKILKKVSENLNNLDLSTIAEFLASFHKDCSEDTKYSEWSNKLLFEVTKAKPDLLLQLLYKNDSLDKELIKREFENPINHDLDLVEIIHRIERANSPDKIKKEIIESLKKANSKG